MKRFLLFALPLFFSVFFISEASAQIIRQADFAAIFPTASPIFNPNGKFIAGGESGGVVGPTANGCDLYGFRAQVSSTQAVSLGMQGANTAFVSSPTLSFESFGPFLIQQQNASGGGNGSNTGCGKILAQYFDQPSGFVYTVFGSALASGGIWQPSDLNLKRNVKPVENALDIVKKLNGVTYDYRTDEYPAMNLREGRQYGFIAQEVREVLPEATQDGVDVEGTSEQYTAMNYDMIIPVLTEAIKIQQDEIEFQAVELEQTIQEQNQLIEQQQQALESQQQRIEDLERAVRKLLNDGAVDISSDDSNGISLRQNRPNPTNGITSIEYALPFGLEDAQLVLYNTAGQLINRTDLVSGNNSVDINTGNLAAGAYIYTIEQNGKVLARQKMMIK